jgi:hypothetical protein
MFLGCHTGTLAKLTPAIYFKAVATRGVPEFGRIGK